MYNSDNQRIQHLRGLLSIFCFKRVGKALYQCVLSKTRSTRIRGSPLSPNGSQVLRRQQYTAKLALQPVAQAPIIQYSTMVVLQPGAQAPTYNTIQYNACTASRCLDAYNTIQCLDYDQVLRRLIYCFAD